jgi:hypothetical protein
LAPFMEPEERASWRGGSAARCWSSTVRMTRTAP